MKKRCAAILALFLLCFSVPAFGATEPLVDGEYTVEATLSGGTGRAQVESPALLSVKGGLPTATITWSSPYYEFMVVDGVQYDPVQTEGNATFSIPVTLDEEMTVQAQTVAMSEPHLIDYTLYFDSATLQGADSESGSILPVVFVAVVIAAAAGWFLVRKRRGSP